MDRWNWNVAKAYAPAVLGLAFAYGMTLALGQWQADPVRAVVAARLGWVPYAALGLSLLLGLRVSARLWQAERGTRLLCECGGLLAAARRDRRGRVVCACRDCGRQWKR